MSGPGSFVETFYPFLGGGREVDVADGVLMDSVRLKAADSVAVKAQFFATQGEKLLAAARALAGVYRNGGRLLTMGNGGSSCDAAHVAVEFTHPVTVGRPALPAINLVCDAAMITAVGNDVAFADIFARQIIAHGRRGDGVIGISTSGGSANVLAGFAAARRIGLVTIALVGGDGGRMAGNADIDHCLVVASDSIHRIQECHVAIYHMLWDLVHTLLAASRGDAGASIARPSQ
jgi:D-sedoheptulose 7-phosphate isomerase